MMIGLTQDGAVCRLTFMKGLGAGDVVKAWKRGWPKTEFVKDEASAAGAARRMFAGKAAVDVELAGTPFQQRVWKELLKIPPGQVVPYAVLARRIKKPKAARAVGNALGANPVPILVPCHRVIAGDGSLGGYTGGTGIKQRLLKVENVTLSKY
jgi:AraC family transcriptional regulator, regulatory protein of adaptative response / methylated-DNA-[protein]-cysteine methyltransferase